MEDMNNKVVSMNEDIIIDSDEAKLYEWAVICGLFGTDILKTKQIRIPKGTVVAVSYE